ncbi:hypothetical protein O181_039520 [Austropuccinia psidii MF-1]|uniref:Uncharacterized protein n=1 Tax=Austropuccinia psidii MF-1 TaxID=1389203 RepID=A0A9Q3DF22_9BASI|nr:hypothetical protein [Austropuccinia psidii MF-1]
MSIDPQINLDLDRFNNLISSRFDISHQNLIHNIPTQTYHSRKSIKTNSVAFKLFSNDTQPQILNLNSSVNHKINDSHQPCYPLESIPVKRFRDYKDESKQQRKLRRNQILSVALNASDIPKLACQIPANSSHKNTFYRIKKIKDHASSNLDSTNSQLLNSPQSSKETNLAFLDTFNQSIPQIHRTPSTSAINPGLSEIQHLAKPTTNFYTKTQKRKRRRQRQKYRAFNRNHIQPQTKLAILSYI